MKRLSNIRIAIIYDESPDPSYLNQEGFEARKAEYENGDFHFVGIRAEAQVEVSLNGGKDWICDTIKSPGLWGIESDSDEKYLQDIGKEELNTLREMLYQYGFKRLPKSLFKNLKPVEYI